MIYHVSIRLLFFFLRFIVIQYIHADKGGDFAHTQSGSRAEATKRADMKKKKKEKSKNHPETHFLLLKRGGGGEKEVVSGASGRQPRRTKAAVHTAASYSERYELKN